MPRLTRDDVEPPAAVGTHDGLAYALFLPAGEARGGVVVLHGAGSCKENHFDWARAARAEGLAAVVFDQRGHGDSPGALGAGAIDDVATIAELLPEGPVALRGSSMGGYFAIAAAERARARAVVAICPASGGLLRRGLRESAFDFAADTAALDELLARVDLDAAAAALGPRLLLLHAEGDERVPVESSEALHLAAPGSRFIKVPGGHHRSVQHDEELRAIATRWIADRLRLSENDSR